MQNIANAITCKDFGKTGGYKETIIIPIGKQKFDTEVIWFSYARI